MPENLPPPPRLDQPVAPEVPDFDESLLDPKLAKKYKQSSYEKIGRDFYLPDVLGITWAAKTLNNIANTRVSLRSLKVVDKDYDQDWPDIVARRSKLLAALAFISIASLLSPNIFKNLNTDKSTALKKTTLKDPLYGSSESSIKDDLVVIPKAVIKPTKKNPVIKIGPEIIMSSNMGLPKKMLEPIVSTKEIAVEILNTGNEPEIAIPVVPIYPVASPSQIPLVASEQKPAEHVKNAEEESPREYRARKRKEARERAAAAKK